MMTLPEISDRLEIQRNLWDYANAVDMKDFDALDDVFSADAMISYGGCLMSLAEAKRWLKDRLTSSRIRSYYHMMGNMWIHVDGDQAESRTHCFNPMEFVQSDGRLRLWLNGMWYHWRHIRTPHGWRITGRTELSREPDRAFAWSTAPYTAADGEPPVVY